MLDNPQNIVAVPLRMSTRC